VGEQTDGIGCHQPEALILASNQQIVLGSQAQVRVL
jgi:hypothetical protein